MLGLPIRYLRPTTIVGGLAVSGASYACIRTIHAEAEWPPKVFGRGPAMVSLSLESSTQVNHNTKRLRFKLPHDTDTSGLSLTSALLVLSWPKGRWLPVARPYTPISASTFPGALDLLVKRYPHGKQSTHLHSLQPGDSVLFAAAIPGYNWKPNNAAHVTLIAGGSGITPIYQLAQGILDNREDKTSVTLVYAANTDDDILLKKELDAFYSKFPSRFKAVYVVSQPAEGSMARKGRVTKQLLEDATQGVSNSESMVFVCGPPAMEKALLGDRNTEGILMELGYEKNQVHSF
ncbi:oxidoreductase NAD-binding domain-containing protein [Boeremia exigua]|uniref:oxidoreductase NAD-binding domain-containing protein n=1 Tax=Boeremia exigua TaxID=749465 RepID=UPI001E8DA760|nr:oxidoreductase NAD-binding domain-containing protein [Boeremia exigua]KAH6638386.1 oxidoreductase NAD-binding domain-containing protein [Boeremia exigua]